jgi:hypothetical protein
MRRTQKQYQLVIQWPYREQSDYDHLIAFENMLFDRLPRRLARVDGHDFGSGEMNIFVFTDHPAKALDACRSLIRSSRINSGLAAGYREINGETFVRLWPPESTEPFEVK